MTKPIVSIIIPAYNCGENISPIVNRIINQPFSDWELLVIDDKSTDNTADILDKISKKDDRIKIFHQKENGGASVARNFGIQKSRGKYLIFFDSDDNIKEDTLLDLTSAITNKVDLAVGGFTVNTLKGGNILASVDVCTNTLPEQGDNETFRMYILRLLGIDGRLYQVWNKIYRADIIKKNKIQFQPGINFGEDLVFNLNYFANMTGKINFLTKSVYTYNQSIDSGTFSKSSLIYENRLANYKELEKFLSKESDTKIKSDLLGWISYSWLYSHLLAISGAQISGKKKLDNLRNVAKLFNYPPIGDQQIIGKNKVRIEKMLESLIKHPRLCLFAIKSSNRLKNHQLTASVWRRLQKKITV